MCGIAGIYNRNVPCSNSTLRQLAVRLSHRGPDANGHHISGTLGLAHTRLAIIDLAGGKQPLINHDGTLVLVANGEIYNYVELRDFLQAKGHRFTTNSDCETILHAYAEWGTECLNKLCGMFAFALFDTRTQKLFLARDRLGIKPLFVHITGQGIRFSSELAALIEIADHVELNTTALGLYLEHNFISGPESIVQGITKIMPGQAVEIHRGQISRRWTYWRLSDVEPSTWNYDEAAARFDGLMADIMPQHLRSDVPFGVFLSGGVDSSILVAMIRRYTNQSLRTYSVSFRDSSVNSELLAARRIADLFQTEHTELMMDERQLLKVLPETIAMSGELMADYANLPTYLLAAHAKQNLRVIFTGEGGDEVFAGYGRYRVSRFKRFWRSLLYPGCGGYRPPRLSDRFPSTFLLMPETTNHSTQQPFIEAWQGGNPRWSKLEQMQSVDIATWLVDDLLVKTDRMLMAHGIEGRVPFLDHRIVEFGIGLPDKLKVRWRIGKIFLRRWAEQFLPKDHLWTRKRGFSVPIGQWLKGHRMRKLSEILENHACTREFLNHAAITKLLNWQLAHGNEYVTVWALLQFGLWYERFIELTEGQLHKWIAAV